MYSSFFALAVVLFDIIVAARGFFRGSRKVAATGSIGLLMSLGVPCLVVWLAVRAQAAIDSDWAVQAERRAIDLLKGCPTVAGLGKLQALEGSGFKITSHPWDLIGGLNGHLMLLRRGRFDSGGFPVVIVAYRGGGPKETEVPAIVTPDDTFLHYVARLPDRFVYVVLDCRRPPGDCLETEASPPAVREPSDREDPAELRRKEFRRKRQEVADESIRLAQRIGVIEQTLLDGKPASGESAALSAEEKAAVEKLADLQKRLEEMDSSSGESETGLDR